MFRDWLIGNMGTPGEYMYRGIHIWSTVAVFAVFGVLVFLGLRYRGNPKAAKALLLSVALFQLVFEIGWRLIYFFLKGSALRDLWPMYPCNLGGILLPLFAIFNLRRGKQMFYLFGFVGGVLTFAMPEGIFTSDVLVFPILKSILQHTGILLSPVLEYVHGSYRPSLRHMGWITAGCIIHAINCEVIARLVLGLDKDFMFFRSGLPFVIEGVPSFITISVFALLVLTVLSFLGNIRDSINFLRRK